MYQKRITISNAKWDAQATVIVIAKTTELCTGLSTAIYEDSLTEWEADGWRISHGSVVEL